MKILVPLDGSVLSEAVLPFACLLARTGGYSLTLLSVWDERETMAWQSLRPEQARTIEKEGVRYLDQYLSALVERLQKEAEIEVDHLVRSGHPATEIALAVEAAGAAMIAMTTHGRSGLARWTRGSVADSVLHTASVPILLVGPESDASLSASRTIERILVPLDGSSLSEVALDMAVGLAQKLAAKLILLRVEPWVTPSMSLSVPTIDMARLDADVEEGAKDYLNAVRSRLPDSLDVDTVVLRGTPARMITDYEREAKVGLVVMCSHGRKGLGRLVLGSVANKVLAGPAPVLLIYPEAAAATAATAVPMFRVRRCHVCGRVTNLAEPAPDDICIRCRQHLRTCANCVFYDGIICMVRRPEINDLIPGNHCPVFQFRETPLSTATRGEEAARNKQGGIS